jgi:DNA-binding SARP family transcriptional activator
MRFRVLGPVQVCTGAGWVTVNALQQRLLLSVLLASAGDTVPVERLAAEIWGDRQPATAVATIRVYVMHLRRMLGDGSDRTLVTKDRGYRLVVDDADLDALLFDRLYRDGQRSLTEGDPASAAASLSRALALWQGAALADAVVPGTPLVIAEAARLERRRLGALERYFDAQLDLGHHADVVEDLSEEVSNNPLRERLREQLMLALSRCGRRAEALEAYRRGRDVLVADLGLEPGPGLQGLHLAILAGQ